MPQLSIAPNPASKVAELEREALATRGTENQRQRYDAGFLPEDELLAIARAELFQVFTDPTDPDRFKRWHSREFNRIDHKVAHCRGRVFFQTTAADYLRHDQWERLANIKDAAQIIRDHHWVVRSLSLVSEETGIAKESWISVNVEPLVHIGHCEKCNAVDRRQSVKVTVMWAGRSLSREFAL